MTCEEKTPAIGFGPRLTSLRAALATSLALLGGVPFAQAHDTDHDSGGATQLRRFIDQQVGGIGKLVVPPDDASIPLPRQADGSVNPRYQTTEAKRYLGKMMFHDPVRTARIDPTFGGVPATSQTASCGSCHLGEAAGKAGAVLNFAVGGEGRGYTDQDGNFIVRRRPRSDLPQLRQAPLFPGDARVDSLPTLTDIYLVPPAPGVIEVATPARGRRDPQPLKLMVFTTPITAPSAPRIIVQQVGGQAMLTWPASYSDFTLEEATSLLRPDWTPVASFTNQWLVPAPGETDSRFYRLRWP